MRQPKPKLGFRNKNVDQQVTICANFLHGAGKLPAATREGLSLDKLSDAINATEELAARYRALRSEARAVRAALNAQAARLRRAALSNVLLLSNRVRTAAEFKTAGLRLEKDRRPVARPGAPTEFRGETGDLEGTVRLIYRRPVRRCVFVIERAEGSSPTRWKHELVTTHTRPVLRDLAPGQYHWFRVAAINKQGRGPWSQPIRVLAP
jgi:hypothetical protein